MLRPRSLAWEGSCTCHSQHLAYIQTLRLPERELLRWNQGCLWVSTHLNAGFPVPVAQTALMASRCGHLHTTNDK